jgi:hypothetical protein
MPRTFFAGSCMVPDPPDFNWQSLEHASGLTFTETQRTQRFCQVVEAETLIRRAGAPPEPTYPLGGLLHARHFGPTL